jgi:hypothetical protein
MRTIPVALALVACALPAQAAAAPGPVSGERAAGNGYTTYVACSLKTTAQPATECRLSQAKATFFLSTRHDATYKVCVKFPGKKKRLCASAQPSPKGKKQFVTIATANTGKHRVAWYVGGKKVGSWNFVVTEG